MYRLVYTCVGCWPLNMMRQVGRVNDVSLCYDGHLRLRAAAFELIM